MLLQISYLWSILFGILWKGVNWSEALETGNCQSALGMQSLKILDEHITASSYFDEAVNAFYARAHVEQGGGAWCPKHMVHNEGVEYLEVDLLHQHIISKVEVQGRFGNGQGKEFAESFKIRYWRDGLGHWVEYKDGRGSEQMKGNTNTYLAQSHQLSPPLLASAIRFVPYSRHPRTVCMRVEIYGCPYEDGLVSYSMQDGDDRGIDDGLRDVTYDGLRQDGYLSGGLGQLTDGETGHTNFRVDAIGKGRGYEWIGWRNDSRDSAPIEILFEYDDLRNFSAIHLYTNNLFTKDVMVFSKLEASFSAQGERFTASPIIEFYPPPDRIFENARNITVKLNGFAGKYLKIKLFFASRWIMISEVAIESVLCHCNLTDKELNIPVQNIDIQNDADVEGDPSIVSATSSSSDLLLGGLVTLGVVFGIVPIILGGYYYKGYISRGKSKTPSLTNNVLVNQKGSMKLKDFHINMNLSSSDAYKNKGKLYGQSHMDDEIAAMYQEPYKGPLHNPGYYTLNRANTPSDTPLKIFAETDESVDYAIPDVNMTPPPPFSEVYTPPPPVPSSKPPTSFHSKLARNTPPPPIPAIPPPPERQYCYPTIASHLPSIQGVTGTVIYSALGTLQNKDTISVVEVPRHRIKVLENLGEGVFGVVQLCEIDGTLGSNGLPNKKLCAYKVMKPNACQASKDEFKRELALLATLDDPNIVKLLGAVTQQEPLAMLLEYMEHGDLYQFLRRHISEETVCSINCRQEELVPPSLSYGALIYISTQIASGMKYLEALNVVHRDLACRNCLVGKKMCVKISDFGMSRPLYSSDYYRVEGRRLLPIRWMSWESILQGKFTTKSDVWSFGVTLWEILSLARTRPFNELSDEGVLENVSHCYHEDGSGMIMLSPPPLCPREIYDMIKACLRPIERQRPPFWEIHMFLQRKNLGYSLDYVD